MGAVRGCSTGATTRITRHLQGRVCRMPSPGVIEREATEASFSYDPHKRLRNVLQPGDHLRESRA